MEEPSDNRIAYLRERAGLTKVELGKLCLADASQISRLENGDTQLTVTWQRKIANALNVKPSDLLLDKDYSLRLSKEEVQLISQFRKLDSTQQSHAAMIFNITATAFHQIATQSKDGNKPVLPSEED